MKFKVFIVLSLSLSCSLASASVYRWVDESGKIHYSDSVPPAKSQMGHAELNKRGLQINKVAAAKSSETVAEEKWLAELEQLLVVKNQQQTLKDSMLLNSYSTLDQFDALNNERLKLLSDEQKQFELLHSKLLAEFKRLINQLKNSKSDIEKKRVQKFIDINKSNTEAYESAINQNKKETAILQLATEEQRKRLSYLLKNAYADKAHHADKATRKAATKAE